MPKINHQAIYDAHRKAFASVNAYAVLLAGERVANIAIKYPRDGAGRLTAFVHWYGVEMSRGYASGGGYDKASAAVASAARTMPDVLPVNFNEHQGAYSVFLSVCRRDASDRFYDALRKSGFEVIAVI